MTQSYYLKNLLRNTVLGSTIPQMNHFDQES